ncbi:astacin-like metalloprotease toxin 2 [Paramacrobiotus metropolitanus]|uniref:astacin-like metalloprotease toxin 2 n=1 Tax=Paramacrobiotus metropolitanus TaxID=2943436 RepID=UPI002445E27E|nr:astacin-like metalloprotease toxin 2 [Paramacrobiotus metropolitanus]XP_055344904.1 astacin-like metalloprotease toxin 2 [Paramacrobiotus metropolitanus]
MAIRSHRMARNIITSERYRWPNGTIAYAVQDKIDNTTRDTLLAAMRNISRETNHCIRFRERRNEDEYLDIIRSRPGTCAAGVGRQRHTNKMFVSAQCSFADLLHVLLHVLGFFHEHTRPDHDSDVHVSWENIPEAFKDNYPKPGDGLTVLEFPHYFLSITRNKEFAYSCILPVMIPMNPTQNLTTSSRLSDSDIKKILRAYEC